MTKRPKRFYNRAAKVSGELKAGSIGDLVKPSSNKWRDHYQCTPRKAHAHVWLVGTTNKVCSICGKTEPKDT